MSPSVYVKGNVKYTNNNNKNWSSKIVFKAKKPGEPQQFDGPGA
jgi:hypothetical protein